MADRAAEYGYTSGDALASPGHLRVIVSPEKVTVDYVQSNLSADQNGQVAYSYSIP